jgi:hypothetical protein
MIVDKRVFAVLVLGVTTWYVCCCGSRVGSLRDLADLCVMIELLSRTSKKK